MLSTSTTCVADSCPLKNNCARYANHQRQLAESEVITIINPTKITITENGCQHRLTESSQCYAFGFKNLAGTIPSATARILHSKSELGSRSNYYRYYRGEKGLSPSEQQRFLNVIKELGGNPEVGFDRYEDIIIYVKADSIS